MMRGRLADAALAALALLGLAVAGQALHALWQIRHGNARIAALASGHDVAVPDAADPALLAARGELLLAHGRLEEAQAIADRMVGNPATRSDLLYDLGNVMLRRGLAIYFTHPMRETAPLIRIAQAEYREALHDNPDNWDARFNLDIANALVREDGPASPTAGTQMAPDKATVPDEPGAPSGLP